MTRHKKPLTPRGMRDLRAEACAREQRLIARCAALARAYGFQPLETGILEYADAIGADLPDQDRPHAGVFAFEDEAGAWLALRYDLTAPLARFVAQNYDRVPRPFRRAQWGPVFRNEKPGPGRFRQFTQFDADIIGAPSAAADAEMIMLLSDCVEAAGIARGAYAVCVNNRKILDGVLENAGLEVEKPAYAARRLAILRAIDKYARLGSEGVRALLGEGRTDKSGDKTKGAGLAPAQIDMVMQCVELAGASRSAVCAGLDALIKTNARGQEGLDELRAVDALLTEAGVDESRARFDPGIVRGLAYYTGLVFEAVAGTKEAPDTSEFGSLGGGGRYDDLLLRFGKPPLPATGMSLGISRLAARLEQEAPESSKRTGPVVVLVMEAARMADYMRMAAELRACGVATDVYMGAGGMRAQMKYADRTGAPFVVIEGADERAKGVVVLKDLALGQARAGEISDNAAWRAATHAQTQIPRAELARICADKMKKDSPI